MEEESAGTEGEPPNNPTPSKPENNIGKDDSAPERAVLLGNVSSHVTCGLCRGYLIDAQTITDCVHSFCRSCLLKYLKTHDSCPRCGGKVYTTQPLLNIRSDRKLQDLIYKLVPNLFKDEMLKRREFFRACPPQGFDFSEDQKISVCLRLCDRFPPYDHVKEKDICVDKRFLLCPGHFTVKLLEKFVRLKFSLTALYKVSLFCDSEGLYPDYTLLDVILVHRCPQTKPLLINCVVQDQSYTFLRQLKMVEHRRIVANRGEMDSEMTRFPFNPVTNGNDLTRETDSMGSGTGLSPNGVSIHIKHKDGMYHVTSPKDMDSSQQAMYLLQNQKKKRGRPPKRPPTGVVATQKIKKNKKDVVKCGFKVPKLNVSVDNKHAHSALCTTNPAPSTEAQPPDASYEQVHSHIVEKHLTDTRCSEIENESVVVENVNIDKKERVTERMNTSEEVHKVEFSTSVDVAAPSSTNMYHKHISQHISGAVSIPVSQPVLHSYPAATSQSSSQSHTFNTAESNLPQLAGSALNVVNSSYQVLAQVPNMVSSNGVLRTGSLMTSNQTPYTVSCMPMAIPKIKRKRGRPPKNRSLMGFPGRCSPMPRPFGMPGTPMYALVKKKRGRPPKRKVGLPPVLVVPQHSQHGTIQLGRNLPLPTGVQIANSPVYVDSNTGMRYIQSSNGMTYVNTGNNVQYSAATGMNQFQPSQQVLSQSQSQHPVVFQNNNNVKQENNISNQLDIPNKMVTVAPPEAPRYSERSLQNGNQAEGVNIVSIAAVNEDKLEQDADDTSMISHEVVGDIINKLSEDRSNSATPLSSTPNCTATTTQDSTFPVVSVDEANQSQPVKDSSTARCVTTTSTVTISKANVSPYERQFENFLQRTKTEPTCGRELILSDAKRLGYGDVGQTNNVEQVHASSSSVTNCNQVLSLLQQNEDGKLTLKQSDSMRNQNEHPNVPSCSSLPVSTSETNDHKMIDSSPSSNPTSPYSDSSLSKDGTPNSKRSLLSSSDLKEQKRHNINKLTEKLHSIGEKKRPPGTAGVTEAGASPTHGPVSSGVIEDNSNGLHSDIPQRKSVISTLENNKTVNDGTGLHCLSGKPNGPKPSKGEHQPSTAVHPRHSVLLQSHLAQTLQGTVPRVAHSVMSLPPTSLGDPTKNNVGYARLVSNGYLHSLAASQSSAMTSAHSNSQTVLSMHSNSSGTVAPQAKIIDTKTGLVYHPKGAILPQDLATLQNGANEPIKMPGNKGNASKRLAAQKKKQAALQRLNGKNKSVPPPQGPFYVGVNFFNCPYGPQGGSNVYRENPSQKGYVYSNSGQVKEADKKYNYTLSNGTPELDNANLMSDKPLDFSLKKAK